MDNLRTKTTHKNPYVRLERIRSEKKTKMDPLECIICGNSDLKSESQPRRRYEEQVTLFKTLFMTGPFRKKVSSSIYEHFTSNVESCGGCLTLIKEVYALHQEIATLQHEMHSLLERGRDNMITKVQPGKIIKLSNQVSGDSPCGYPNEDVAYVEIKEEESLDNLVDFDFEEVIMPDGIVELEPAYEATQETDKIRPTRQSKLAAANKWKDLHLDGLSEFEVDLEDLTDANFNPNEERKDVDNKLACSKCGKIFKTKYCSVRHEIEVCNIAYTPDKLKKLNITLYPCKHCDKKFTNKTEMTRHFYSHTSVKARSFWCRTCEKVKVSENHQSCRSCSYIFIQKSKPTASNENDNNQDGLEDNGDNTTTSQEEEGTPEDKTEHPLPKNRTRISKEYPCSKCGKVLKELRCKISHEVTVCKIHYDDEELKRLNVRFYKCDQCGNQFLYKKDLIKHSSRHTGVKPFNCEKCGEGFRYSFALAKHNERGCTAIVKFTKRRSHDGGRVNCKICDKSLSAQPGSLKKHIRRVHQKEIRFTCSHCQKGFFAEFDLSRHVETRHEKGQAFANANIEDGRSLHECENEDESQEITSMGQDHEDLPHNIVPEVQFEDILS